METCAARTPDGRLPDLNALARGIAALRLGATLRGVEVTASGWVVEDEDQLLLVLSHTGEVVRLAPLRAKVQWDREQQQAQPATEAERAAYERLRAARRRQFFPVRIVGPLSRPAEEDRPRLEVREFLQP
jgi:hypothetical protein